MSFTIQKDNGVADDDHSVKRPFGCTLLVLTLSAFAVAADAGYVVHKRVSEVRLTLVATDSTGRPWQGLSASNLAISDEGRAIPDFQIRVANDLPLRVGVLLDLSDSTAKTWPAVRMALAESMSGLMQPGDEILMTTFSNRVQEQNVVGRPEDLNESLHSSPGGLTALYDSLYITFGHPVFSEGSEPRRSAIILFSDGEDTLSCRGMSDALEAAQRRGIAIYTISTHKPSLPQTGDSVLHYLASSTGGRDFVVKDQAGLRNALQSIHDELRNSYLLYYRPAEGGKTGFRHVLVLPAQSANLHLRTRAGYYPEP